jgi:phospholipid/cholesterol/gamma-HCH transport system substrate-binding protein
VRRSGARTLAVAALVVALALVAIVLLGGAEGGYVVRARFLDSGQLVKGNVVEVAGQRIGMVESLELTDDGRAEVAIRIDDERYVPLHRGTRMTIRTVGLSGVANRYVDVTPGSRRAPRIEDGGELSTQETTGAVDLDMLFNALGPQTREDIRTLLVEGARGLDGNERALNRMLGYADPAVAQGRALLEDVLRDEAAVERLVTAGARVSRALAAREGDVEAGIVSAAATMEAVDRERAALARTLGAAPGVLAQARGTLAETRGTLEVLRPALREARPVAPRLATTLRRIVPVTQRARPVVDDLLGLLGPLRRGLRLLPAVEAAGTPALRSAASAVRGLQPILEEVRPYAIDVLQGLAVAPGGAAGAYDANGHYARVAAIGSSEGSAAGASSLFPDFALPPFTGERTRQLSRCPGGAGPPAADGSTPFAPPEAPCDPRQTG